jgi:chromosome transmission fidelity protein 18
MSERVSNNDTLYTDNATTPMGTLSPPLPFSSDPALNQYWEEEEEEQALLHTTFSDDIEALQLVQEEENKRKTKAGIVIQHRSWKTAEVFRSEAEYLQGNTSVKTPIYNR